VRDTVPLSLSPHAAAKTQNPMTRKQRRRALHSHAHWRPHPVSPAPHARQQAAPLLPTRNSRDWPYKYCSQH
jgi:hypothetical protein